MAENEKGPLDSLKYATLWLGNLHKVTARYFWSTYIVQLYKEYFAMLPHVRLSGLSSPQYRTISILRTSMQVSLKHFTRN